MTSKPGHLISILGTGSTRPNQAQIQDTRRRMNQQPAIHGAQITADAALAQPPIGALVPYAGAGDPPDGKWLACDGRTLYIEDYPDLYAVLGTKWNNGTETPDIFRIPDCRGRSPVGAGQGEGLANRPVAQKFGAEEHTLAAAQMPTHDHGGNTGATGHSHGGSTGSDSHSHSSQVHSAGAPHRHTALVPSWEGVDDPSSQGWPSQGIHRGFRSTDRVGEFTMLRDPIQPESATHSHGSTISGYNHNHSIANDAHNHAIPAQGGGLAHNNMQPSLAFDFIIRALV